MGSQRKHEIEENQTVARYTLKAFDGGKKM